MTDVNPRFVFSKEVMGKFELTITDMVLLTRGLYPEPKNERGPNPDEILVALAMCKQNDIPWQSKAVELVPFGEGYGQNRSVRYQPVLGLAWWTRIAQRSGLWLGKEPTEFGETVKRTLKREVGYKDNRKTVTEEIEVPEWAQVTVLKKVGDTVGRFAGTRAYFDECLSTDSAGHVKGLSSARPRFVCEKAALKAALSQAFGIDESSEDFITNSAALEVMPHLENPAMTDAGVEAQAAADIGYDPEPAADPPATPEPESPPAEQTKAAGETPAPPAATDSPMPAMDDTPPPPQPTAEEDDPWN